MSETFHGPEAESHQPKDGAARATVGYPPPGQAETLAAIQAAEADLSATEDADAVLAGLDSMEAGETAEERQTRLQEFIELHCADLNIPAERLEAVIVECQDFEDEGRELFDMPELQLEAGDASTIRNKILALDPPIETQRETSSDNEQIIVSSKAAVAAAESTREIAADIEDQAATVQELNEATAGVEEVENRFLELRGEGVSTTAALNQLLAEGDLSPEAGAIVQRVLNTTKSLISALPGKTAIVEQFLNQSSIDFSATNTAQMFAGFLAAADNSDQFSEAERTEIRRVLGVEPQDVGSASDLQDALKNGRGTEQITEIQEVEEPLGSGNFVEREVVVGERPIPFSRRDRLVMSDDPRVTLHPVNEAGDTYRLEAQIPNAGATYSTITVPKTGNFPEAAINNHVNEMFLAATFASNGLSGALDHFNGQGDGTTGSGGNVEISSVGGNDMTAAICKMCLGTNTLQGNRFLTGAELQQIGRNLRWLTPGGDFGPTNRVDGSGTANLMTALLGGSKNEIQDNMARASQVINTGGAEQPSFEALYVALHPEDAANNFENLRRQIGEREFTSMAGNLSQFRSNEGGNPNLN